MMRQARWFGMFGLALFIVCAVWFTTAPAQRDNGSPLDQAKQLYQDGNFKDAYDAMRKLTLASDTPSSDFSAVVDTAIACLQQLNRTNEIDEFREAAVAAHPDDWRLLMAVAQSYINIDHHGFMIAGQF